MKTLQSLPICAAFMLSVSAGCQEDYVREIQERPTETIDFNHGTVQGSATDRRYGGSCMAEGWRHTDVKQLGSTVESCI